MNKAFLILVEEGSWRHVSLFKPIMFFPLENVKEKLVSLFVHYLNSLTLTCKVLNSRTLICKVILEVILSPLLSPT